MGNRREKVSKSEQQWRCQTSNYQEFQKMKMRKWREKEILKNNIINLLNMSFQNKATS